jgi:hypothetical protein
MPLCDNANESLTVISHLLFTYLVGITCGAFDDLMSLERLVVTLAPMLASCVDVPLHALVSRLRDLTTHREGTIR